MTIYVSIGNSDDKLTQKEWSMFFADVAEAVHGRSMAVYGEWASLSDARWQNACWCFDVLAVDTEPLKDRLAELARTYRQDSIAWAEAPETEFL